MRVTRTHTVMAALVVLPLMAGPAEAGQRGNRGHEHGAAVERTAPSGFAMSHRFACDALPEPAALRILLGTTSTWRRKAAGASEQGS